MVGQTFGHRYEIIEELEKGGMGTVYKARHQYLDDVVALKMLPLYSDENHQQRFLGEAQKAMACRHVNVVGVYDYVEEKSGVHFLVMEYVPGMDLKHFIEKHKGRVPIPVILDIVGQLCAGLAEIHRHQIVHRDLKPENIRIESTPEGKLRAVIIDFGIAKSERDVKLTDPGSLVGTYAYMSPEQIEGDAVDTRSDIYSLGVLIYYLMTGNPPFQSTNTEGFIKAHLTDAPPPLRKLRKELPRKFQKIIGKALAKKPDERYQTAESFWQELQETVWPSKKPFYKMFAFWQTLFIITMLSAAWYFQAPLMRYLGVVNQPSSQVDAYRLQGDEQFYAGAFDDAEESYKRALAELENRGFVKVDDQIVRYLNTQIDRAVQISNGLSLGRDLQNAYEMAIRNADRQFLAQDFAGAIIGYKTAISLVLMNESEAAKLRVADSLYQASQYDASIVSYKEIIAPDFEPVYPVIQLIQSIEQLAITAVDTSFNLHQDSALPDSISTP